MLSNPAPPRSILGHTSHNGSLSILPGVLPSMHRLVSSTIAFAATALLSVQAQNLAPAAALEGFTADPSIRVFGDTYYL